MGDFPTFLKNPSNRIAPSSQHTEDVEGYLFDGADGSQVVLWTCLASRVSKEHTHDFDEYVLVIEGECTAVAGGERVHLTAGQEHVIPAGVKQSMEVTSGTRTMHAFGGKRARRASEDAATESPIGHEVVLLENAALVRWCRGDPSGFLEISAPDVVYFDPFLGRRMDGITALTAYYEGIRGKIRADRFELIAPRVQQVGVVAVLTFNFVSYGGNENGLRWNCTEVYRHDPAGWRIIQTHWSFTNRR